VSVPGSKSLTNRAILTAALATGTTTLHNALFADDTLYLLAALQTLGFIVDQAPQAAQLSINGLGGNIPASKAHLFVGNAGTTARFLVAMLTLGHGEFIVDGDKRMRERPFGDLIYSLQCLGGQVKPVKTTGSYSTCLPLRILGNGLEGGSAQVAGDTSSQYLSAILMAAPYARNPIELKVTQGLSSRPYVDMTIALMADFGVSVQRQDYSWFYVKPHYYQPISTYRIEADASAASYFFAAPAICGGNVIVRNLSLSSRQGDISFLRILQKMGCAVEELPDGIAVYGPSNIAKLRGVDADLCDIPDTAQTLAVIAPFANTPTTIHGIASSRLKETDRIAATCTELSRLGVEVAEHPDGMTIWPCHNLRSAKIHTYHDHRMAMAFALIGLRVPGVMIGDPGCVSKSFPEYFSTLERL
jgi:3-phosphoshikimate 1-carboxyvinyltransferase